MNDLIELIEKENLGIIKYDVSLKTLTSLGIGGVAKYLYFPKDVESLIKVIKFTSKKNLKYFILGNGTNLLFKDVIYEYLFIKLSNITKMKSLGNNRFWCEAGAQGITFSKYVISHHSSGSEFLSIIPGVVGGLIYMNASSYNKCIGDYLEKVEYLDSTGNLCVLDVLENNKSFDYRKSFFSNTNNIILKGYFKFLDEEKNSFNKIKDYMNRKKISQPLEYKSAGSTFRNFKEMSAWELIDKSGFRNFRIGNVCISKKHANFLINLSDASFNEAYSLIKEVKRKVYDDSGYKLECELEIVEP